ncbi:MAG: hypothetical protein EOP83_21770 [Verrucomicrobiaceae bacterium]|nr:MAG: hypothetical protein EOP83_21770 [Verrucomicrobiaceae bacterium]
MASDRWNPVWYVDPRSWIRVQYTVHSMQAFEDVSTWLRSDEASGYHQNDLGIYLGKPTAIRFTDRDTAFAFKMKFG